MNMVAASETLVSDAPSFNGMTKGHSTGTSSEVATQVFAPDPGEPCFMIEDGKVTKDVETCYSRRDGLDDLLQTLNTFRLVTLAFEQDVTLDATVMEMVTYEPEFLPVSIGMVEELVPEIRDWDEGAVFRFCAFTDPDASGEEELQFVVQYSDDIPEEEMNRKWDEMAERMNEIAPTRDLRSRVGITFQPFW
jgi:hypothetical protein